MKNIVIMPNSYKDPGYESTKLVIRALLEHGACVYVFEGLRSDLALDGICYYGEAFPENAEMILVIGGDGSVLDAAVYAIEAEIPLIGLNLGRLGYLAELNMEELSDLSRLVSGDFDIREYITFSVTIVRGDEEVKLARHAVNDVVLSQGEGEGLSEILLDDGVGDRFSYLADGIIVATPLGSTAYSLAAGGPVVDAALDAFCVTPICAHSLFSRSLLFSPEYTITLKNCSRREGMMRLSVDGGESYAIAPDESVRINRAKKRLRMITLKKHSALDVLCRKMQLLNPQSRKD